MFSALYIILICSCIVFDCVEHVFYITNACIGQISTDNSSVVHAYTERKSGISYDINSLRCQFNYPSILHNLILDDEKLTSSDFSPYPCNAS